MSIAQTDIEKYDDNIPVLRVVRWLQQRSVDIDLLTTLVAMRPRIVLNVGDEAAIFHRRCVGLFTGSRSAAATERFPLQDVAAAACLSQGKMLVSKLMGTKPA